jgi:hypothetical protein
VFIAFKGEGTSEGLYSVSLCSPHAAVASPEGQAMLMQAARIFGGVAPPAASDPPATAPAATATPAPQGVPAPGVPGPALDGATLIVVLALLGGVIAGTVLTVRRLGRREG